MKKPNDPPQSTDFNITYAVSSIFDDPLDSDPDWIPIHPPGDEYE